MSFELHRPGLQLPVKAATTLAPRTPVRYAGTSGLLAVPVGTCNLEIDGYTGAGTTASGAIAAIYETGNVVKAVAAASLGAGAQVTVGSDNSRLIPFTGASGTVKWVHGKALSPAADGEVFALFVRPRQTGGLA